jgi:hypothetical protein
VLLIFLTLAAMGLVPILLLGADAILIGDPNGDKSPLLYYPWFPLGGTAVLWAIFVLAVYLTRRRPHRSS